MSNFIIDCITGKANMSAINDYIDKWHDSETKIPLHEFLGMSDTEYGLFVQDESYLANIVADHRLNKNVVL